MVSISFELIVMVYGTKSFRFTTTTIKWYWLGEKYIQPKATNITLMPEKESIMDSTIFPFEFSL